MDEAIPSISSGSVGSRFVSQTDIDTAKARREEQWKAAYARLGQEPPPQPVEDVYDGRSLAEKLAANKAAKQEEWEEKTKLGNQFRALEEDEVMFLDTVRQAQEEEERQRKERDGEEIKGFREAIAARANLASKPPPLPSLTSTSTIKPASDQKKTAVVTRAKKDVKNPLKGVLVKKKSKPPAPAAVTGDKATMSELDLKRGTGDETTKVGSSRDPEPVAKRRKVSESSES